MLFKSADIAFLRPEKGGSPMMVVDAPLPDGAAEVIVGETSISVLVRGTPVGHITNVEPGLCARLRGWSEVRLIEVAGATPLARNARCRGAEGRI